MHLAVNAYFWNQPQVGSGQYVRHLVANLNGLVSDLRITLVYPYRDKPDGVPDGVNVIQTPARAGHLGKVWFEQVIFPKTCRALKADVAHVPYWGPPLRSPVPLVVTIHDLITLSLREYRRPLATRLYNSLVSAGARGANEIVTDSRYSAGEIARRLHISKDRISPIHLAAAPRYHDRSEMLLDMALQQKYDLPDFYVLYLGGYNLHKNVLTLLQAYTYVAQAAGEEYPLVLAGLKPDPSPTVPDYAAYIRRSGLEPYVRWIGYVDEPDKPALYRGATVFAFPSRYEGFGLPPLEAMACGAPVVTTNAASLPEVVGEAAFAVDPDDARQMGGAILSLIVQGDFHAEMRQKGLEQAGRFSWETTATETVVVYDRVAND